jgi:uncharacterized protein
MARTRVSQAAVVRQASREADRELARRGTHDSFVNFQQRVGRASGNPTARGGYAFNPVTRLRVELEWAYRSSWIVRKSIDCVADDMVRAGVELGSDMDPKDGDRVLRGMTRQGSWRMLNKGFKWARLYGGAIVVPIIPDQNPATPLRIDRIQQGSFKGLAVFDRWQLTPSFGDLVTVEDVFESADEVGLPRFYTVMPSAPVMPGAKVHHSRAWRLTGPDLPYWQQIAENLWDLSSLEPLFDRLVAFDSSTQGAAQLIYRAYLRTLKIKGLKDIMGQDPDSPAYTALVNRVAAIRDFQVNEGFTVVDDEDSVEALTYTFSGLSDMMLQFGQQISGSTGIPLVRLFGQSPSGLNSTGESDLRTYYDEIAHLQDIQFRGPVDRALRLTAVNQGVKLDSDFWFTFRPLWQLTEEAKASVAAQTTQTVADGMQQGIVTSRATALKELKQQSRITGVWTNITSEDIEAAENEPPPNALEGEVPGIGAMGPGAPEATPGISPDHPEEEGADEAPNHELVVRGDDGRPKLRLVVDALPPERGMELHGLPIYIETFRGERRMPKWPELPCHYGYLRCTGSAEGPNEGLDVFVGDQPASRRVWVVNQVYPGSGIFDEHKAMLGFADRDAAMRAYALSYGAGAAARIGSVREMEIDEFKRWLESHPATRAA